MLVTGGAGFLGGYVIERLAREGPARLLATTRAQPGVEAAGVSWARVDLRDVTPATWTGHGFERFDLVVHLAGHIRRAPGREDPAAVLAGNVEATQALLESLPAGCRLVYASTVDVYGTAAQDVITEASPALPETLYASAKLFGERMVRAYAADRGWTTAILRYGNAYGPGDGAFTKLVPVMAREVVAGRAPVITGSPESRRDLIFAADVAEATARAALSAGSDLGPLNVVTGCHHPVREVVETLLRLAGSDAKIACATPDAPPASLLYDNRRLFAELGEWSMVSLEDGLRMELEALRG